MTAILDYIIRFFSFFWLTGPVFDKELRVSSRQRRNYVLRFAYIFLLLTILIFIWVTAMNYRGMNVIQVSRMARAGTSIVNFIVWFQFCAAQIIAAVMLSNSISDEINHKTLGTLMTTPITSLQIVTGKMFSKLLQLILLVAISLPLLAVVRIFGGVQWSYIISSLCLTLTTVLLVSSLSLFYSIFCRKAYVVIISTILTFLVVFALFPFLYISLVDITDLDKKVPVIILEFILHQPNPYLTFYFNSYSASYPGRMGSIFFASSYISSAINLIFSFTLLFVSIIMVRKAAICQATGQPFFFWQRKKERDFSLNNRDSATIGVFGPPIFWKDLILPSRKQSKIFRIIGLIIFLVLLFYSYWYFTKKMGLYPEIVHVFYVLIFMGLGMLFTIVRSATAITSEKETRSLPLLLISNLNETQIINEKLYSVLCRGIPIWTLLIFHFLYFDIKNVIHPISLVLIVILVVYMMFFLCSSGIYFSSLFKHTTTAVIMNFIFAGFIWGALPLILYVFSRIINDYDYFKVFISTNPFIQVIVIIISTLNYNVREIHGPVNFKWPMGDISLYDTLIIFGISFCVYMTLALIFLWRAKKRLRHNIF